LAPGAKLQGVELLYTIKVSAGMPWPMSASIENIMAERAQASISGLLLFCCQLVESRQAKQESGQAPAVHSGVAAPAMLAARATSRRWSSTIAATSFTAVEVPDLEMPLLMARNPSSNDFQDAVESFASPLRSPSGYSSENEAHRGMSRASTSARGDQMQSCLHALQQAAAAVQVSGSRATSGPLEGSPSDGLAQHDLQHLVIVLQGLHHSISELGDKVDVLMRGTTSTRGQQHAAARAARTMPWATWATVLLVVLAVVAGLAYAWYVYHGLEAGLTAHA